jgi:hypothetical protein
MKNSTSNSSDANSFTMQRLELSSERIVFQDCLSALYSAVSFSRFSASPLSINVRDGNGVNSALIRQCDILFEVL